MIVGTLIELLFWAFLYNHLNIDIRHMLSSIYIASCCASLCCETSM